MPEHSHP